MIGSDQSNRYDVVGDSNDGGTRHCDNWIEVTRRKSVREIAEVVGKKCLDESKIGTQRRFEEVFLPSTSILRLPSSTTVPMPVGVRCRQDHTRPL